MKILLIGKNGQIGSQLEKMLPELGEVTAFGREECDLTDRVWLRTTIRLLEPKLIINATGYTNVEQAEQNPDIAWSVNAGAPALLADEAMLLGAGFVHYSTDYIFDGKKKEPYLETDEPNPLNVYGASKLDGERLIQNTGAAALILRTSWLYGLGGNNFPAKVFKAASEMDELRYAVDQFSRPTWAVRVAQATVEILRQRIEDSDFPAYCKGVYHVAARGSASRFAWARAILHHVEHPPKLTPVLMEELEAAVERPRYSALDCSKLYNEYGIRLPDWRDDMSLAMTTRHMPDYVPAKLELA